MTELDAIASLVIQKGMSGKIAWLYDGMNLISTKMDKNIIEIRKSGNMLLPEYAMIVRDEDGTVLSFANYSGASGFSGLFEKVRRDHLGVDKALENIKNRLQSL